LEPETDLFLIPELYCSIVEKNEKITIIRSVYSVVGLPVPHSVRWHSGDRCPGCICSPHNSTGSIFIDFTTYDSVEHFFSFSHYFCRYIHIWIL